MKVLSYSYMGGIDLHDTYITSHTMKGRNGNYDVKEDNIPDLIYDYLLNRESAFMDLFKPSDKTKFANVYYGYADEFSKDTEETGNGYKVFWNDDRFVVATYYGGEQYTGSYAFHEEMIEDKDIFYYVTENFLHPAIGLPNIERLYREPFTSLDEAEEYLKTMQCNGIYESEPCLHITSKDKITQELSAWIKEQLEVAELMTKAGQTNQSGSFYADTQAHKQALMELTKSDGIQDKEDDIYGR